MYGLRCNECGEVRWSILGRSDDRDTECPACGAVMVEERRHPGHKRATAGLERRDAPDLPHVAVS
jgi:predicted nucleic acid-binding Zn ribbon protein